MYRAGIITASDKGSVGEREDLSGPAIRDIIEEHDFSVVSLKVLPDDRELLSHEMVRLADDAGVDVIFTTGGTGFSKRDVTPEATKDICHRDATGIAEAIRGYSLTITKRAMLSRAYSGIRGNTLIINLPGSPKAVRESLEYIIDSVAHGLDILTGRDGECAR